MTLRRVACPELPVVIAPKDVEHAVRSNKDSVIATSRHPADILVLRPFDELRSENLLVDVTKSKLPVIIAAKSQDFLACGEYDGVIIAALEM